MAAQKSGISKKKNTKVMKSNKRTAKKKIVKKKTLNKASQTTPSSSLKLGQVVPAFVAPLTGGKEFSLKDLKGKKVVLYFYPRDATPGCTLEGHDFTKLHDHFKKQGAEIFGISRDTLTSHEKFKAKECYSIDLLSDENGEICKMFDVIKMKNMYGKKVLGIERSTFVIDSAGCLVKEWRGVKVDGHAKEVLDFITSNQ